MASSFNADRSSKLGASYGIVYVVIICSAFMFAGPTLILVNKHILSDLGFHYPFFLSAQGVFVTALFSYISVKLGYVALLNKEKVEGKLWFQRVLPVGFAHASALALGNLVYLWLNVGTIQMLKSFTPVTMLTVSYFTRVETLTTSVVVSVLITSLGTAATCSYTPQLSILGFLVMFLSGVMESVRLVLTQNLLQNLNFGVTEGQYFLSVASCICLFTFSLLFEIPEILREGKLLIMFSNFHVFFFAALLGLLVNYLSYYVIQATSSLTMKILGTLRNILTIFLGVLFYAERISFQELVGYSIALIGFILYNMSKSGFFQDQNPDLFMNIPIACFNPTKWPSLLLSLLQERHRQATSFMNDPEMDLEASIEMEIEKEQLKLSDRLQSPERNNLTSVFSENESNDEQLAELRKSRILSFKV